MLKILNVAQIKACDAYTIEHEPVASIDLMERACRAFFTWFSARFEPDQRIGVVCGTGNNGGDGLGIARMLKDWGYPVKVWIVRGEAPTTSDFTKNLARLENKIQSVEITSAPDPDLFRDRDVLIDAIFGSGLSRPVTGIYAHVITTMNNCKVPRVAVDIPSGLFADRHSSGSIIQARHTLSFQLPKLAFMLPENGKYVGEWHLVDIRLSKKFMKEVEVPYVYLTAGGIKNKLKVRSTFDHKGDFGKALLIAGSYGKMGASILAARAALRSGVGLLTVHVPVVGYPIVQAAVPVAMATVDTSDQIFSSAGPLEKFTVVGIGPGIGQAQKTVAGLEEVFAGNKPMVIDADALNILATHPALRKRIPAGSILTPHPKEFERLVGSWSDDFERLAKQMQLANEINAVVVVKGAHTSIAIPQGAVYFNSTGNPGMATGGSGDVLTGVLTGLLAQGYSAADSAIIGVYLHGLSGDLAATQKGMNSLIASDIIDFLPLAFKKIAGGAQ